MITENSTAFSAGAVPLPPNNIPNPLDPIREQRDVDSAPMGRAFSALCNKETISAAGTRFATPSTEAKRTTRSESITKTAGFAMPPFSCEL
jgi:hypothetical protein